MRNFAVVLLVFCIVLALAGCVERKMLIRSEPTGAPVWVDEEYVGLTPLDHSFSHYGLRRIRVGPIRDEADRLRYLEDEIEWEFEPPWYETFPIDFLAEVVYPGQIRDEHAVPAFVLSPAPEATQRAGEEEVRQIRARARAFRDRALRSIPESAPAE
ncbi:MAG: PEGA domain-containing protein [Planctomycetota bacterium]|jgi:hypothetical protein